MAEDTDLAPWIGLGRIVDGGLEFGVRVQPGARRTRIVGEYGDRLKIQVSAPPERGRANQAVCEVIAAALGVPTAAVAVIAGHTCRDKVVRVRGAARLLPTRN